MEQMPNIIETKKEEIIGVSENEQNSLRDVLSCFPAIKKCILYGSRVTGVYSEKSDLDIYLEITGKTSGQISDIKNRIQQMLSSKIRYPIHIKDKNDINNRQLLRSIENTGVEL